MYLIKFLWAFLFPIKLINIESFMFFSENNKSLMFFQSIATLIYYSKLLVKTHEKNSFYEKFSELAIDMLKIFFIFFAAFCLNKILVIHYAISLFKNFFLLELCSLIIIFSFFIIGYFFILENKPLYLNNIKILLLSFICLFFHAFPYKFFLVLTLLLAADYEKDQSIIYSSFIEAIYNLIFCAEFFHFKDCWILIPYYLFIHLYKISINHLVFVSVVNIIISSITIYRLFK